MDCSFLLNKLHCDEIELNKHDIANMKSNMLDQWLRSTPKAAWKDVVSALRIMKENCTANSIEEKYCGGVKDVHTASGE